MKLKPRIICENCDKEKIVTQSLVWKWNNTEFNFCTRTCGVNWFEINLKRII